MNPWILIMLVLAAVVFGLDFLLRRKKWNGNTREEKTSLLINMFSVGVYLFLSALGMLWGIAANSPETPFGETVYDVTLTMGGIYFIIAAIAVIASLILRKMRKTKASIWVNIIAFAYIAVVLGVNTLAGKFL